MNLPAESTARFYRRTLMWAFALFAGLFFARHAGAMLGLAGIKAKALMLVPLPLMLPLMRAMEHAEDAAGFHSPARGRFNRRAFTIGLIYLGLILAARLVEEHVPPGSAVLWLVVIVAVMPILMFVRLIWAYLDEETDDFLRDSFVQMSLVGTAALIAVATCWGFLAGFGLTAPFEGSLALPIWASAAVIADIWNRKRGR